MKTYYKRQLKGFYAEQILILDDGQFEKIWNVNYGNAITRGCLPNEFEVGQSVKRGFLAKYGFKKFIPTDNFLEFEPFKVGDWTGHI